VLLLGALSFAAWTVRERHPWFAFGWAWFVITLLPVIGIVQVGMQAMADRYMYVPLIGLTLCAADFNLPRASARPLAAIIIATLGILAWRQTHVWHDGETLFRHALAVTHDNFIAHDNLGVELDARGQHDEALKQYREALRIEPGDRNAEQNYAQASFQKGERLFGEGKPNEALASFQEGFRYRPRNALARTYAGLIRNQLHQPEKAIPEFRMALDIDLTQARAWMGLGVAYAWTGQPNEAAHAFSETVRLDSKNVEAYYDLGLVLAALEQYDEAIRAFDDALKLNPRFGPAVAAKVEVMGKKR
jgi:tetratricopeptide (TPR) repeat protein